MKIEETNIWLRRKEKKAGVSAKENWRD